MSTTVFFFSFCEHLDSKTTSHGLYILIQNTYAHFQILNMSLFELETDITDKSNIMMAYYKNHKKEKRTFNDSTDKVMETMH